MLVHPPPILRCFIDRPVGPDMWLGLLPRDEDLLHLCRPLCLESEAVHKIAPLAEAVVELPMPVIVLHLVEWRVAEPEHIKAFYAVQPWWWWTAGCLWLFFRIHKSLLHNKNPAIVRFIHIGFKY